MRVREALAAAAARLAAASDTPRLDAELLMAHALGIEREEMLLQRLGRGGARRLRRPARPPRSPHEPVAYITGRRAFWTIELEVGPGVLIPRPDSETLIEAAVAHFGAARAGDASSISAPARAPCCSPRSTNGPRRPGSASTRRRRRSAIARRNAERLGLADAPSSGSATGARGSTSASTSILCNPPYVEAGADAAAATSPTGSRPRRSSPAPTGSTPIAGSRRSSPRLLAPGGIACVEIGAGQAASGARAVRGAGLHDVVTQGP